MGGVFIGQGKFLLNNVYLLILYFIFYIMLVFEQVVVINNAYKICGVIQ